MSILQIPIKSKTKGPQIMTIDAEDYDKIKHLNITLNYTSNKNTYYAKARVYNVIDEVPANPSRPNTTKKTFKYSHTLHIHRVIMGLGLYKDDKRIINHIDGNGLNNCKSNLEICDTKYNSQSHRRINAASYSHISYDTSGKRLKRWRFCYKLNGVRHQKRFKTKEEAEAFKQQFITDNNLI